MCDITYDGDIILFMLMPSYLNIRKCKSGADQNVHLWQVTKHFVPFKQGHKKLFDTKGWGKIFCGHKLQSCFFASLPYF